MINKIFEAIINEQPEDAEGFARSLAGMVIDFVEKHAKDPVEKADILSSILSDIEFTLSNTVSRWYKEGK